MRKERLIADLQYCVVVVVGAIIVVASATADDSPNFILQSIMNMRPHLRFVIKLGRVGTTIDRS